MAPERRTRILIVDDSAVMRSLLRSVVCRRRRAWKWPGPRRTASRRLRAIETLHPDLVLLDVEMPVMDGLATLQELRTRGHHDAGHHVQFAHPARRPGHHRSSGQRRVGLRGQARRARRPRGRHADAGAGPDSQNQGAHRLQRSQEASANSRARIATVVRLAGCIPPPVRRRRARDRGHRRLHRRAGRARRRASRPSCLLSAADSGGPAHAGTVYRAARGAAERPLPAARARSGGRRPGEPGTISIARGNWHLEVLAAARALPQLRPCT